MSSTTHKLDDYTAPRGGGAGPMHEKDSGVALRKRLFVPCIPNLNQAILTTPQTGTGVSVITCGGDAAGDGAVNINSTHVYGIDLDGNNEEIVMSVPVPDDMDVNQDLWVFFVWAPETVSTGDDFDYVVTYSAQKITDYVAATSGTAVLEPTNALNATGTGGTALNETAALVSLTQYAPYRSMKGIIPASIFERHGIMSFKIECDAAPASSEVIQALGLELFYVQRKL